MNDVVSVSVQFVKVGEITHQLRIVLDDMRVYIANLGKYNEGELVGDWFSFPIDEEDVSERIGLNSYYEEYAVHDTDNFPIDLPALIWYLAYPTACFNERPLYG